MKEIQVLGNVLYLRGIVYGISCCKMKEIQVLEYVCYKDPTWHFCNWSLTLEIFFILH